MSVKEVGSGCDPEYLGDVLSGLAITVQNFGEMGRETPKHRAPERRFS